MRTGKPYRKQSEKNYKVQFQINLVLNDKIKKKSNFKKVTQINSD